MLSKPVLINNQYFNSMNLASQELCIDKNTVKNRIKNNIKGYTFCEYQPPKKRKCSICNQIKLLKYFKKAKNNRCQRSSQCTECHNKNVLKYLQTSTGKILSQKRSKKYRKTTICKQARSRYKKGINGKAAKARYAHQRRVRMSNVINNLSTEDWLDILKEQNNKCIICDRIFNINLQPQRDHIIPVVKGGAFTKINVQALCINCNSRTGSN